MSQVIISNGEINPAKIKKYSMITNTLYASTGSNLTYSPDSWTDFSETEKIVFKDRTCELYDPITTDLNKYNMILNDLPFDGPGAKRNLITWNQEIFYITSTGYFYTTFAQKNTAEKPLPISWMIFRGEEYLGEKDLTIYDSNITDELTEKITIKETWQKAIEDISIYQGEYKTNTPYRMLIRKI